MKKKLFDSFCSIMGKACKGSGSGISGAGGRWSSGHHTGAISDGLRKGSSQAGRVMARWRWRKK